MASGELRFGLHDFLNAQPLLVPLLRDGERFGLRVVVDFPSRLADRLESAELDLAMVPTIEYLKNADRYRLVPGLCIASRGAVKTVLLVSRVSSLEEVKTVAVDQRSRTSVALLKILLADRFPADVEFHPAAPDPQAMLEHHDAALIIGDQALAVQGLEEGKFVVDLSEEWFKRTGKTFVHAVVAVRVGVVLQQETVDYLRGIKRQGMADIDSILKTYIDKTGRDIGECREYLRKNIIYDLGKQELEGIECFCDLCREKGLLEMRPSIRFVGEA